MTCRNSASELRVRWSEGLLAGASALALGMAAFSLPAMAQDTASDDTDEQSSEPEDTLTVVGIRSALDTAQDIKRDSDVFVDAIVASDIGALPDRSVSEALQRVPGVNVLRFAGPNDPDHFAVEGSGVIVRGLPFVRSELNGRDVFAANSGGRLGFEDVSPELLGSVAVFKNQSADMIEGGLAGTVDLRTRLPFDSADRVIALSAEATYSDFVEELTPSYSALFSDQWETDAGTFGLLVSGSVSNLKSRADGTQFADFIERTDIIDGETVYLPRGGGIRTQEFDRDREAFAIAGQWESNDGRWLATAQFMQSDATLVWGEQVLESSIDDGPNVQLLNDDYTVDGNGLFTSGIITENVGWRGNDNSLPLQGVRQLALARERYENDVTRDYGFNVKFSPTDRLRFNFDAQYVDASTEVFDVTVHGAFFANTGFDLGGESGSFGYFEPAGTTDGYFQDPGNYYWRSQMDHAQDSTAESVAFRGDVEYDFSEDGWLRSVRGGVRRSDKETELYYSNFNWGNVSEIWTGSPLLTLDDPAVSDLFSPANFDNFQRSGAPVSGIPIYSGPLAADYAGYRETIEPILAAQGSFATTLGQRGGVVDGTLFLPSEFADVSEESTALYVRGDFVFEDFLGNGFPLEGNVGVRYVATDINTRGVFEVLSRDDSALPDTDAELANACDPAQGTPPGYCSQDLTALTTFFGTDATLTDRSFSNSYEHWLPSLNMKLNVTESSLVRLGLSRSMARPEAFDLRPSVTINILADIPLNDGVEYRGLGGTAGNPFLEPLVADQFDLSYEWYFDQAGSVTLSYFYKEIDGYWTGFIGAPGENEGDQSTTGSYIVEVTNNGVTLPATIETRANSDETASLQGFEISYQQFYDFLPDPLDGVGVQFNYTYVDASGVADIDNSSTSRFPRDDGEFERVSEHQFNLVGLYEKGPVQARLAYNWRDEFLLTKRDVIYPFASIYQEAGGQVDGSIFYDVNDSIKLGLQGVNLLDSITETTQTINEDGLRAPRTFNRNDRRYSLIMRATF